MTATAHPTTDGTSATSRWLASVTSPMLEFVWPMYLTLVLALGAWVVVPAVALGWKPVAIMSGSMAPAVQPGHVVVVEPYGGQDLGPGTVVTYRDPANDRLVTHRISAVEQDGTIRTRGDGNAVDDPVPLTRDRIVGVGRLVVPAAGLPALWAQEGRTDLLATVVVLSVLAAGSAAGAASTGARALRQRLSLRGGARGPALARRIALAAGAVTALAVLASSAVSGAAFVGAEHNPANAWSGGTVPTPTDVTTSAGCAAPEGGAKGSKPAIEVTWTAGSGVTAYELQRAETEGGPFTTLGTVSDPCYRDTDVNASVTYLYEVRALAGPWVSQWSATVSGRLHGRRA